MESYVVKQLSFLKMKFRHLNTIFKAFISEVTVISTEDSCLELDVKLNTLTLINKYFEVSIYGPGIFWIFFNHQGTYSPGAIQIRIALEEAVVEFSGLKK